MVRQEFATEEGALQLWSSKISTDVLPFSEARGRNGGGGVRAPA